MPKISGFTFYLLILVTTIMSCNNKEPFKPDYNEAVGVVVGKEYCKTDTTQDYWLVAIHSSSSVRQQYGDTVTFNGIKYHNVVKTTGIPAALRIKGNKIGFDFYLSDTASLTRNCAVDSPKVYKLKIAELIHGAGPAVF